MASHGKRSVSSLSAGGCAVFVDLAGHAVRQGGSLADDPEA
jgi:hypothetical protein